ncbi:MAG: ribbon-helix-helix protein, CopG family [Pseudonocardiaceae bacterium]
MSREHGTTRDGIPITDETVEALADAERGYHVEDILRRQRGGRPAMGSAAAGVESVRLDPEMKRALLLRAAADGLSVSETIRRAVGAYLKAG